MLKRFVLAALTASALGMSSSLVAQVQTPPAAAKEPHDPFYFLGEISKASVVMLKEVGIIPPALASRIAGGIEAVLDQARQPGAERSSDYLKFEPRLVVAAGPDASMVHAGRSRQACGRAIRRARCSDPAFRPAGCDHVPRMRQEVQAAEAAPAHRLQSGASGVSRQMGA